MKPKYKPKEGHKISFRSRCDKCGKKRRVFKIKGHGKVCGNCFLKIKKCLNSK